MFPYRGFGFRPGPGLQQLRDTQRGAVSSVQAVMHVGYENRIHTPRQHGGPASAPLVCHE